MDKNKIQGLLGAAFGITVVGLVVTENLQLYPKTFTWAWIQNVYTSNFYLILAAAVLYYPVIFGYLSNQHFLLFESDWEKISVSCRCLLSLCRVSNRVKYYLEDKEAFDLGGAKSKGLINWIFWWEAGLALFSIIGAYYTVPGVLNDYLQGNGFTEVVCSSSYHILESPRAGYWISLFCVSCISIPNG